MNDAFTSYGRDDVRLLVERYPLAWVQGRSETVAIHASLLPLIGEYDDQGSLTALIGHLARQNPLHHALSANPRATILFTGPQGYISPEHAGIRDWAPTWNYVQLRVDADLHLDDALTEPALDLLINEMERGRPQPWRKGELGERYSRMAGAIIGFRAQVIASAGIFKLGQDERPDVLAHILRTHGDAELVEWMRRFNR